MSITASYPDLVRTQIPFNQVGELVFSPKVVYKQSIEKINETKEYFCNITFSDFDNSFKTEILRIEGDVLSNQLIFIIHHEDKFIIHLKLNGYWELANEPAFQLNTIDWFFEEINNTPSSAFSLETFKAMLCLSNKIKVEIPAIEYYFENSFHIPLNIISENLQNRQLAYRLLVIERAFQTSLTFPRRFIASEEVEDIAFCYHAIVDREFDWFSVPVTIPWVANKESLSLLPKTDNPFSLTFEPELVRKVIFEVEIFLGIMTARINEAVIDNYDEVKEKLDKLDNNPVKVKLRSKNGMCKMIAVDVPILPPNAWSNELQKLIDLDEKLDSVLLDKYFELASSTLEGLTEEQKKTILERPHLDENGFDF
jgi:hypothetical protein